MANDGEPTDHRRLDANFISNICFLIWHDLPLLSVSASLHFLCDSENPQIGLEQIFIDRSLDPRAMVKLLDDLDYL